ncbi:unnamed protein product [Caenorhabditis sp. 36 PRJEB53466]|nr:unnamed protein product [Caenorhabditis sp. 36 PRJEB53466]
MTAIKTSTNEKVLPSPSQHPYMAAFVTPMLISMDGPLTGAELDTQLGAHGLLDGCPSLRITPVPTKTSDGRQIIYDERGVTVVSKFRKFLGSSISIGSMGVCLWMILTKRGLLMDELAIIANVLMLTVAFSRKPFSLRIFSFIAFVNELVHAMELVFQIVRLFPYASVPENVSYNDELIAMMIERAFISFVHFILASLCFMLILDAFNNVVDARSIERRIKNTGKRAQIV